MEFNKFKDRACFFQYINKGPYPDEEEKMKSYSCFCKICNPSVKDREILKATESKSGLTMIVRSSKTEYLPQTNHLVKIDSALYSDKLFNIVEIGIDTSDTGYNTVVLSEKRV